MDKKVSIVKVDKRHYRVIARENWGLTREQMKGKHVHHRIKRSDGGTNDPSNLYVCSEWYHDNVWHAGEGGFAGCASAGGSKGGRKVHESKNEEGKSLHAVRAMEKVHQEKNKDGKSKHAVKLAEKLHEEKDEQGRSLHALRALGALHDEKNEEGKSKHAVKAGKKAHEEKNEEGKSKHGLKAARKLHEERDDQGRSLRTLRLHREKDERGKSKHSVRAAQKVNSQIWKSTVDGFVSTAAGVVSHNKSRGWDPNSRMKVGVKSAK
jgi:hypothetical protein